MRAFFLIICFYSISVSKLLILTGEDDKGGEEARKIEVVDLQNPLNSCSLPEEFPTKLKTAVGGFTKDGPLLCGGHNSDTDSISNDCFILHNTKFVETEVNLKTARERASAVVLPNGELWIHGGGNFGRLWSSEKISLQASEYGLQLEKKIAGQELDLFEND